MKRILFFLTLFVALGGILNAQTEFTGNGDGSSWDDPFNWINDEVPQDGDDILIDGFFVDFYGDFQTYGSLELINNANLFLGNSIFLYGDFTLDTGSTLSIGVGSDGSADQIFIEEGGNYFFNGSIDIFFHGYVPQIGDEFQFIDGAQGSCGTSTTGFAGDSPNNGFEVTLGTQCEADGLSYIVTSINYTTAIQWDGEGGDGLWNNPLNWDPNGVPPANSQLIFNLPGAGGYANTDGAGTTTAYSIKVGKNNTLAINGNLTMTSTIYNNPDGTIVWNAGELAKSISSTQSLLISYGNINMDGPGLKKIDGNFEIWNFRGDINHNQGNLEINNGKIRLFNDTEYNVGNSVSIGYSSGTLHDFEIGVRATVRKDNNNGTSTINLTNLENNGKIICETGTLDINGSLTTGVNVFGIYNGSYRGNGAFGFPTGHMLQGEIRPGSSPGVLTVIGDFATSASATFIIEIDGPNAGTEYDQVSVTNEAILDGDIEITLGYLPANDASFQIVSAVDLSSCNFPTQITTSFNGTPYTFNVVCFNNSLYLNGPDAVALSTTENILDDLKLYPNPASSVLNIKSNLISKGNWQLINQLGQAVKVSTFNSNEVKINVNEIPTGIYFFKIEDDNLNATTTKRIVISN